MGDPVVTPAAVGFGVTLLLTEVINAAKMAYSCKDECNELVAKLENMKSLVEQIEQNSSKGNGACTNWLSKFKMLLERAKGITNECILAPRSTEVKRALKFWRWKKLPSRVMKIKTQIEDARLNASLVTLGIVLSKEVEAITFVKQDTPSITFVIQDTPSLIVGVDEHFKKLKTSILQSHEIDEARYFGLQGRGGAGKTLLAKMLNNDEDIQMKYGKDCIIWMTVGLDVRVSDLYEKMGKSSILDNGVSETLKLMKNQEDQRTFLKSVFAEKRVFLILDDVWDKPKCDHYDMMYWLDIAKAPGSATLITSRSRSVLCKVQAEVEVVLTLPEEESWKLFSSHAFCNEGGLRPTMPKELAQDVCAECKGLPLALKVIGSAMVDKAIVEEWRSALIDLRRSKFILDSDVDDELFGRLELSYKELKDDATRVCFLYFATFPEDYKIHVKDLFNMLIVEELFGSNLSAKEAEDKARAHLQILVRRSLIDWNERSETAQVHDILRDLALHIIGKAKHGECARECFFQFGKKPTSFPERDLLKDLKRISLMNCHISHWPKYLQVPHLKMCILRNIIGKEENIPKDFFKNMINLKFLDLSGNDFSSHAKFLSFEGLISTTHLDLKRCDVNELLQSLGNLNSLTLLNLSGCRSLKALPESIGNLNSLTKLYLYGYGSLEGLPKSIGNLISLMDLNLEGCGSLEGLPESFGNLTSLMELNLYGCGSLEGLPKSIGNLNSLTKLDLEGCRSLERLPENMGNLTSLMELNLNRCGSLERLSESIGNLTSLTLLSLNRCGSLKGLSESIGNLNSLMKLYLRGCRSLEGLPKSIGNLTSLMELNLNGCRFLEGLLESIGNLTSFTLLNLNGCGSLKGLPESIGNLNSLTLLDLDGCGSLEELPESINNLTSLTLLNLNRCGSLKGLPESIGNLNSLTKLNLEGCRSLEGLPESIGNLNSLTKLNLEECRSLEGLSESIGNLTSLTLLNLNGCGSLKGLLESIGNLNSLTLLDLDGCGSLKGLPESISNLKNFKVLK